MTDPVIEVADAINSLLLHIHRRLNRHNHNRHSNIPPAILIGEFFSARFSLNLIKLIKTRYDANQN